MKAELRQVLSKISFVLVAILLCMSYREKCAADDKSDRTDRLPSGADAHRSQLTLGAPSPREAIEQFLTSVANDPEVLNDPLLGKPRVVVDADLATVELHLEPVPARYLLSDSDALNVPLEAMIRASVLRRDLAAAFPMTQSWGPELAGIDQAVDSCLKTVGHMAGKPKDPCPAIAQAFEHLATRVQEEAKRQKLDFVRTRGGGIAPFPVWIDLKPTRARLRIMTALQYKMCTELHLSQEQRFTDVLQDKVFLIGRYHYRVEWAANLGGPRDGDFEVEAPATLHIVALGQ